MAGENNTAVLFKVKPQDDQPPPDYQYFGQATIAGISYSIRGWIKESTKRDPPLKYISMFFVRKDATTAKPK